MVIVHEGGVRPPPLPRYGHLGYGHLGYGHLGYGHLGYGHLGYGHLGRNVVTSTAFLLDAVARRTRAR